MRIKLFNLRESDKHIPSDSKLIGIDNVILIPHMGGFTVGCRKCVTLQLIEDIKSYIRGKFLKLEITKEYAMNMTR